MRAHAAGSRARWAGLAAALLVAAAWPAPGRAQHPHGGAPAGRPSSHLHAPLAASYARVPVPARIWTDAKTLARGRAIWAERCALCHGALGDGTGPAAAGLALKPADLTDAHMTKMMPPRYWFWRVSEGGQVEPWRGLGSAMPAWKGELSVADRWAVIVHARTLSAKPAAGAPPAGHRH